MTLWTDEQANIVHTWILGDVHLLLDLRLVLERVQDERVQILHQVLVRYPHELLEEFVALVHHSAVLVELLLDLLVSGITPLVGMLPLLWRLPWKVDVLLVGRDQGVRVEVRVLIFELLCRLLERLEVSGQVRSESSLVFV